MTDDNKQPESQQPKTNEVAEPVKDSKGSTEKGKTRTTSTSKKPRGSKLKRAFWYLVLVIIIATIAWIVVEQPYKQLGLDLSDKSSATDNANTPAERFNAEQQVNALAQRLNAAERQLRQLNQQTESFSSDKQLAALQEQLQSLRSDLSQQRQQLSQLADQLPQQQFERMSHWRLFEAKQTVSAAARLLWGTEDYRSALALLKIADQQLAGIESAAAIQIRQVLASDIARVEGRLSSRPDQLVLTLSGLQQRLQELPNRVAEKRLDERATDKTVSTDAENWRENLRANWNDFLDTFIRIQPATSNPEPLLNASERDAMTLRLDLLMTMAQHAALQDNASLWRSYIDQALPLIDALKGNTDAANDIKQRLTELRQQQPGSDSIERLDALEALTAATEQGGLQ